MRFPPRLPRIAMPFLRLMPLSIFITAASGCIIPVGVPLFPEGDPFTERKLDFIETGTTTEDEIRLTLAEAPYELEPQEFSGGKLWVYSTEKGGWGGLQEWVAEQVRVTQDEKTEKTAAEHLIASVAEAESVAEEISSINQGLLGLCCELSDRLFPGAGSVQLLRGWSL